jgi:hypothetical protein
MSPSLSCVPPTTPQVRVSASLCTASNPAHRKSSFVRSESRPGTHTLCSAAVRAFDLLPDKASLGVLTSQVKEFVPHLDIWNLRCDRRSVCSAYVLVD